MLTALLLCDRPRDARALRSALEASHVMVDHCIDAHSAENTIATQRYSLFFFDFEVPGARALMLRLQASSAHQKRLRIALGQGQFEGNDKDPSGTDLMLFRPLHERHIAACIASACSDPRFSN